MKRRELITLLGGAAAVAWPLAARAQQTDRIRRIGVFMNLAADDPEGQARNTAFVQALQQLGWTNGRNARIDTRWGTDAASTRKYAAELVALAPDVILATASAATSALQQTTRTVSIVSFAERTPATFRSTPPRSSISSSISVLPALLGLRFHPILSLPPTR